MPTQCELVGTALTRLCPPYGLCTDLLPAQAQILCRVCDQLARRANHSKPVQPFAQKYSAFVLTQIIGITPPVSRQMRGVGHRHERAVRCGGRETCARRARVTRTAKSCGPDAAVLASNCAGSFLRGDGGKRAVHRGEHEVSRKATAQGRPGCSACTCMLVCAFLVRNCTRDRGCSVHPVFPAPSNFRGQTKQSSGALCREIATSYSVRGRGDVDQRPKRLVLRKPWAKARAIGNHDESI